MNVLVFGGTLEGRLIVEWLCSHPGVSVVACTATEYGVCLLEPHENLEALAARLNQQDMESLMRSRDFACVVDATHPYAASASANVRAAAQACGLNLVRVVREGEVEGPWISAASPQDAADIVKGIPGNVLLTTGSKDLALYANALPDFQERLYVRVLPAVSSLASAEELGIPARHIIAMQGPFSFELNCALIRDLDIACIVTKASGTAGGFDEKVEAAHACGIQLVVVSRPTSEEGESLDETYRYLSELIAGSAEGARS